MTRTDGPFAFTSGSLRPGSGLEMPAENLEITYRRDTEPVPITAGALRVSGTIDVEFDRSAAWLRDMHCPGCGCGLAFADQLAGHTWSAARDGCWIETKPIDQYGRPIKEADDV